MGCVLCDAQQKEFILKDQQTKKEYKRKDSLSTVKFLDSLAENSYYFTGVQSVEHQGNVTYILFDKGQNYSKVMVVLPEETALLLKSNIEQLTHNLDSLKQQISKAYSEKGYVFNRVKSVFLSMENQLPKVKIEVWKGEARTITGFVLKGYTKIPKRFVANLEKEFSGKIYTSGHLQKIASRLTNHTFVSLEKPPQTLFTKDSTQVYLSLQKKKTNSFDGILGFGNQQGNKITFNGNINLDLRNVFNGFERILLYWQRNPQAGQNFDLQADVPYLFRTHLGTSVSMNIYRQDSTFANFRFRPALYYQFSEHQKFGVRGSIELSSVLENSIASTQEFTKKGFGIFYQYLLPSEETLLQYQTKINIEADRLNAYYQNSGTAFRQLQYAIFAEHNLPLTGNHYLNLRVQSALLDTDAEVATNELFRIGGYRSLRGFNEESLFTDFYGWGGIEYRYLVSNQAFFDVFGELASIRNSVLKEHRKLYSLGLGFNFMLPLGLMTFQISNGFQAGSALRFQETRIHWGLISRF